MEDWWLMGNGAVGPCEGHAQWVCCTGLQSEYSMTKSVCGVCVCMSSLTGFSQVVVYLRQQHLNSTLGQTLVTTEAWEVVVRLDFLESFWTSDFRNLQKYSSLTVSHGKILEERIMNKSVPAKPCISAHIEYLSRIQRLERLGLGLAMS